MIQSFSARPSVTASGAQGLSNYLENYYGQEREEQKEQKKQSQLQGALIQAQKVLMDPNATEEEKHTGLYQALASRPDIAKTLYDQYSNKQENKQKDEGRKTVIRALEKERGLPEGSLEGFTSDPHLAASLTKPATAPKGSTTSQPVPPEVSQQANQVLREFPEANADELKSLMDESGIPPIYSNAYVENRRRQDERKAATKDKRIEAGEKRAAKVLDKADELGKELPVLEASVNAMEDAVKNEDLSFFSPDNIAEVTGIELFRSAKGAQFKTAAKTYFLNDLRSSGARPNQFIEKQLVDALTKVGRSQEANETVIESFKFSNDLKKAWHQSVREMEKQYEDSLGYVPGNLSRIVEETMKPYIEERQAQYESKLKEIAEREENPNKSKLKSSLGRKTSNPIQMRTPDGSMITVPLEDVEEAMNLGATKA
jgi:hypothetical protein